MNEEEIVATADVVRFEGGPLDGATRALPERPQWYVAYQGPPMQSIEAGGSHARALAVPLIYELVRPADGSPRYYLFRGSGALAESGGR